MSVIVMPRARWIVVLSCLLAACGGGSSDNEAGGAAAPAPSLTPSPSPSPSPNPNPSPSPTSGPGPSPSTSPTPPTPPPTNRPAAARLSGRLSAPQDAAVDGDTADPSVQPMPNNSVDMAQMLGNPVTLGGHASLATDPFDVLAASLAPGQIINLFIAEDGANNDLDLLLANDELEVVGQSLGTGKFESLTVPEAAGTQRYFIQVDAFDGASNYVLTVSQPGANPASAAPQESAMSTQMAFVPHQALVQMKDADDAGFGARSLGATTRWLGQVPGGPGLLALSPEVTARAAVAGSGFNIVDPALAARIATLRAIKRVQRQAGVAWAEPNPLRKPHALPNDEFFSQQWHYGLINLPQAWDITTGSPEIRVAVADTGVRLAHPDLAGKFDPADPDGFDFVSDPALSLDGDGIDSNADDPGDGGIAGVSSFHGTHVAGTIGAATHNGGLGVAGVGWDTRIMPLRVLGADGAGSGFDIINAVRYAAGLPNSSGRRPPRAADVLNLSLGGDGFSQSEQMAYREAADAGLIIIASAGNSGDSRRSYPASYDAVVSVGAVGRQQQHAPYSQFNDAVDVAAPGGDQSRATPDGVLSTLSSDSTLPIRDGVGFLQGTSMAAPHMAGVVALMKAVNPALTPVQLDQLLASGAITRDLGAAGRDDRFGHGLIDANLAVRAAIALAEGQAPADNPRLSVQPEALSFENVATVATLDAGNAGTGALAVTSVSDDAPWLTVMPTDVDGDGLGRYAVTVDRSMLATGTFSATIGFASAVNVVQVPVLISVGQGDRDASVGKQYVLLIDPDTDAVVAQDEVEVGDAGYSYAFEAIPPGDYLILSGTDSDNDGFICDEGEACGAFPSLDSPRRVTVDGSDLSGLDFLVRFGLSTPTLQQVDGSRRGYRRRD